jgi:putative lipoic acid-binding regulatory protein
MDKKDFYKSLQEKLNEQTDWPTVYMFKFIIPADNHKMAQVNQLFGETAQITTRASKNGNYLSVSAKEVMMDAESIIQRYKRAEKIEGIISL